jgi:uncharacterized DUF497 family protein
MSLWECEEVFFNEPFVAQRDKYHSFGEERLYALCKTNSGRRLFVVFTIRNKLIRIVSVRDMTRSEKMAYKYHEKKIPVFKTEKQERKFWSNADSALCVDWKKGRNVKFPNLKPTTRTISLRLPESMLAQLKVLANKRDVPYQSLMKIFLAERLAEEK